MLSWGLLAPLRGRRPGGSPAPRGPRQDARRPGGAAARCPPRHRPRPPAAPGRRTVPAARIGERAPAQPLSRPPGHSSPAGTVGLGSCLPRPPLPICATSARRALHGRLPWLLLLGAGSRREQGGRPPPLLPPRRPALLGSASCVDVSSLCPLWLTSFLLSSCLHLSVSLCPLLTVPVLPRPSPLPPSDPSSGSPSARSQAPRTPLPSPSDLKQTFSPRFVPTSLLFFSPGPSTRSPKCPHFAKRGQIPEDAKGSAGACWPHSSSGVEYLLVLLIFLPNQGVP